MDVAQLTTVLKQAMLVERNGYQFYRMAATAAELDGAAKLFGFLADEERKHYEELQSRIRDLEKGAPWREEPLASEPGVPDQVAALFSEEFKARIRGRHHESAALSIGILLEKDAVQFYSAQAEAAQQHEVRSFFQELAQWENEHHAMLLRLDEALRDDYWAENRFSPLL